MMNKVQIIGNAGADPVVRYTPSGGAVVSLTVATSDRWKDKEGQPKERTEWHRVVVYGKIGEAVGKYVKKGSKVYVEGRNQTREWEKDGVKRYTTEIIVDMRGEVLFLDSKPSNNEQGYAQQQQAPAQQQQQQQAPVQQQAQQQKAPAQQQPSFDDYDDSDIPFD